MRNQLVGSKQASVLIVTVLFITLIALALVPVMSAFTQSRTEARSSLGSDQAFYAAETGLARALSYIQVQDINATKFNVTQANKMNPFSQDWCSLSEGINAATGNQTAVRVRIWNDSANSDWKIQCIGRTMVPKTLYRTITATVNDASFAKYAFFNETSVSTMDGMARWLAAGETFNGPVHSNKDLYIYGNSGNPLTFNSDVTAVGSEIYAANTSTSDVHFNGLNETGSDYIPLPDKSKMSALTTAAASGGINLPAADTSIPSGYTDSDNINNYKFVFNSNGTVTITNLDAKTWALSRIPPKSYTPMTVTIANTNGAFVVNNGNVFVDGTVNGRVTVAALSSESGSSPINPLASTLSDGNLIVDGNLVYNTHPKVNGSPDISDTRTFDPSTVTDVCGLIAERNFALDSNVPTNCIMDATLLITGQATTNPDVRTWESSTDPNHVWSQAINQDGAFFVEDGVQTDLSKLWTGSASDMAGDTQLLPSLLSNSGTLYLTGGVVHFLRGQTSNGNGGYNRDYSFDARLTKSPPPFFPTTSELEIIGWQDVPSTTQPG